MAEQVVEYCAVFCSEELFEPRDFYEFFVDDDSPAVEIPLADEQVLDGICLDE